VADVHKVVGQAQLCRLPRLPKAVAGITQHRGRIVTVFDAAALLFGVFLEGTGEPVRSQDERVLVLERMQRHLGLAVDAVDEIEPVRLVGDLPAGPTAPLKVAQHRGRAVFAVDADRLLERMLISAG
jgi:chemotaxis signal transduction protein